jgi:superfamily I DNA and/or RNA helicase
MFPECSLNPSWQVNTVDSFQGREADFIVISTVRSRKLGFADDPKRINVALTRARHGIVVVGHGPTLETGNGSKHSGSP